MFAEGRVIIPGSPKAPVINSFFKKGIGMFLLAAITLLILTRPYLSPGELL